MAGINGLTTYNGIVVIIPTRNRADIAVNAIRSVLDQPVENFQVMVSDNSTWESDREDLKRFCATLADPRLRYVRPPESLSMTAHWEWAIQQALQFYKVSHFLFLTDRMMFKPMALKEVLDRASVYSDKIISYNHDRIVDDSRPIRLEQHAYTGKLLEIKTLRLSYLYSQSVFHHSFPRMLNCVVPRIVLNRIQERFGNVFSSIAPDFNFCCRCLEVKDSILYYDKSLIFHYALDRSNGASAVRGEMTSDYLDFIANLPANSRFRYYAAPIPQLNTCVNGAFHEYLALKQETNSPRFFDIDFQMYLQATAEEVKQVTDPELRAEMRAVLEAHGWAEVSNGPRPRRSGTIVRELLAPNAVWKKLRLKLKATLAGHWTKGAWLWLARHLEIKPPNNNTFEFSEIEEAIDYVKRFPRASLKDWPWQDELVEARQLPFRSQP